MINETSNKSTLNLRSREELLSYFRSIIPLLNPNWTNVSDDDLGMVIVNLIAMAHDSNNFSIDMSSLEHYLPTVNERSNAQGILNLVGYYMGTYRTSHVSVVIKRLPDTPDMPIDTSYRITIPPFSTFTNYEGKIVYSNIDEIVIDKNVSEVSAIVYEGTYMSESYESLDIDAQGRFYLKNKIIPENAIVVTYNNERLKYDNQIFLAESSKRYQLMTDKYSANYVQMDASWKDWINLLTSEPVLVEYLQTTLSDGSVGPRSLSKLVTIGPSTLSPYNLEIINDEASKGWSYPESIEKARIDAPKYVRTISSAVTCQDYSDLIELMDDYYNAMTLDLNFKESGLTEPYQLKIYVVTEKRSYVNKDSGETIEGRPKLTSDDKTAIKKVLDSKRVTTIQYDLLDPTDITLNVNLSICVNPSTTSDTVITNTIRDIVIDYIDKYKIGESFNISKLIAYVHNTSKLSMLSYLKFNDTQEQVLVNKTQRIVLGNLQLAVEVVS